MGTAAIVLGVIAALAWAKTIHCLRRSFVHDGNYEAVGVVIAGPVALLTTVLALAFGLAWVLS